MANLFTNLTLGVAAGQAVSGVASRPQTLQIVSGCVWVTVEGVSHDYWLSAGDSLTVTPGRLVVIESDRVDSRVRTQARSNPKAVLGFGTWLRDVMHRSISNSVVGHTIQAHRSSAAMRQETNCCSCPG